MKTLLNAWIDELERTQQCNEEAIRMVIAMLEELDTQLERNKMEQHIFVETDPLLTITTRMKSELMMMLKIPSLSIDVKCSKRMMDSAKYWLVQVECAEHQV